jgi:hypothetical protein
MPLFALLLPRIEAWLGPVAAQGSTDLAFQSLLAVRCIIALGLEK